MVAANGRCGFEDLLWAVSLRGDVRSVDEEPEVQRAQGPSPGDPGGPGLGAWDARGSPSRA